MGKYDGSAATALKLISKKGGDITIKRESGSSYDPVTQLDSPTITSYALKGVCLPAGKSAEFRVGSLEGKSIVECYFAAKDAAITPVPGDQFSFQGFNWKIVWTTTYDPAGDGAILTQAYAER